MTSHPVTNLKEHSPGLRLRGKGARHARRPNPKVLAVRVMANALALAVTVLVLPGIHLSASHPVLALVLLGAVFGVVNAIVKPLLEFFALPFMLGSFGVVIVIVDWAVFAVFDHLAPGLLDVNGVLGALAGGVLMALLSFVLDGVLGLTPPVIDDQAKLPGSDR